MSVDARAGAGTLPLPTEVDEVDLVPVRTYWQLVRQRFLRHRLAVIAVVILAILIAVSIVVPMATGERLPDVQPDPHRRRAQPAGAARLQRDRPEHLPAPGQGDPDLAHHRLRGGDHHRRHRRRRRLASPATSAAGSTTC